MRRELKIESDRCPGQLACGRKQNHIKHSMVKLIDSHLKQIISDITSQWIENDSCLYFQFSYLPGLKDVYTREAYLNIAIPEWVTYLIQRSCNDWFDTEVNIVDTVEFSIKYSHWRNSEVMEIVSAYDAAHPLFYELYPLFYDLGNDFDATSVVEYIINITKTPITENARDIIAKSRKEYVDACFNI